MNPPEKSGPLNPSENSGPLNPSENTGSGDTDLPLGPHSPEYPSLREDYIGAPLEAVPELAHALLAEAQVVESLIGTLARTVRDIAHAILAATDRRSAARFGSMLMDTRLELDEWLGEVTAAAECADYLSKALGTASPDDDPEVTSARIALIDLGEMVRATGDEGREFARIGQLATDRVSGFAEAEMLHPQILRDLDRLDLDSADSRIARLAELDREVVAVGIAASLAEVRERRAQVDDDAVG